jgi:hypothetical protein
MLESGAARLLYTGIAVNLLALRPEICTLLVIDDPSWFENEGGEIRFCGEYLRQTERTDLLPDRRWVQPIGLEGDNLQPEFDGGGFCGQGRSWRQDGQERCSVSRWHVR